MRHTPLKRTSAVLAAVSAFFGLTALTSVVFAENGVQGSEDVVYVNGVSGNDNAEGTKDAPLQTFDVAQKKLNATGTMKVMGTLDASGTWELPASQKIVRDESFTNGPLISVSGKDFTLKGENANVLSGNGVSANAPLIKGENANIHLTNLSVSDASNVGGESYGTVSGAQGNGGAVATQGGSLTVQNSSFTSNKADRGGAIYADGTSVNLVSGSFEKNATPTDAAKTKGLGYQGGAVFIASKVGAGSLKASANTSFKGNESSMGGAISFGGEGNGLWASQGNTGELHGAIFDGNSARVRGGAIYVSTNSKVNITAGEYVNNQTTHRDGAYADHQGGAIYVEGEATRVTDSHYGQPNGQLTILNALITQNEAGTVAAAGGGGGIAFCPTGAVYMGVDQGAAIFGNTAKNEASADIRIATVNAQASWRGYLSQYALGNVKNNWEGNANPYEPLTPKKVYTFVNKIDGSGITGVTTTFKNNKAAGWGGALAVNGSLIVGEVGTSLTLHKVDGASGEALAGAQFHLYGANGYDQTATSIANGNLKGYVVFNNLYDGQYTLEEVKAPEGYPNLGLKWSVTVKDRKASIVAQDGNKQKLIATKVEVEDGVVNNYHFNIENGKGSLKTFASADEKESLKSVSTADGTQTVYDTITYTQMDPGAKYTVVGTLVNKETGKPVEGVKTKVQEFTAEPSGSGAWVMSFNVPAGALAGSTAVVYEKAYIAKDCEVEGANGGTEVDGVYTDICGDKEAYASHEDINDEAQTLFFPRIRTNATEAGDHIAPAQKDIDIVDRVTYANLEVGKEYTVEGELHIKDGSDNGVATGLVASTTFTARNANGQIDVVFHIADATEYAGKSLVAFENLSVNGKVVAAHKDINDADQTVEVRDYKIGTVATGENGEKTIDANGQESFKVVDTVTYEGLVPGKTYIIEGVLMDKASNTAKATAKSEAFTPETSNGSITVTFNVENENLGQVYLVAFEYLYEANEDGSKATDEVVNGEIVETVDRAPIAVHADINDEAQTVLVDQIAISTSASYEDGSYIVTADQEKATIVDTVTYVNLNPGKEYTVTGKLMRRLADGTGEEIEGVSAWYTFTPEQPNGEVKVTFADVPVNVLAGNEEDADIVVFEKLFLGNHEDVVEAGEDAQPIAVHEDINDAAQTVYVKYPVRGSVKVLFSKVATGSTKELAGATLQIQDEKGNPVTFTDKDGKEISQWITGEKLQEVSFSADETGTYKLVELTAPNGFQLAAPITFTVDNGVVSVDGQQTDKVTMVDDYNLPVTGTGNGQSVTPGKGNAVDIPTLLPITGLPSTGASVGLALLLASLLAGVGVYALRKRSQVVKNN